MALQNTENRWTSRVWQARLLRFLVFVAPIAAAVGAAIVAAKFLPEADTTLGVAVWWASLLGIATSTMLLVDRVARRALPLAVLMQLTMLFPDRAPTRMKMVRLAGSVKRLEERLEDAKSAGSDDVAANAENVLALASALSAHDRLTRGHAERVRVFVDLIAEELDMDADERDRLRWASLLHDIGKLDVHPEILNKDGRPTEAEWEELRLHPTHGAGMIGPLVPWLGEWSLAVEQHHEKYDGTGYPRGLAGNEISYAARIVAVADSYDAITAARSYKAPISAHTAREELARAAGTHFDPAIVRAFMGVSLGRIRWAIGPASWFAQIPFIGGLERIGRDLSIVGLALLTLFGAARGGLIDTPAVVGSSSATTNAAASGESSGGPDAIAASETSLPEIPTTAPSTTTTTGVTTTTSTTSSTVTTSTTATSTTTTTTVGAVAAPGPTTTIARQPSPRPPVATADLAATDEDVGIAIAVLGNDSDPDGDSLVVSSHDTRSAFGGAVVCTPSACDYTPATNFNGVDTFDYVVSDQKGGLASATVTIDVAPINDAPVARADNTSTSPATPVVVYVLINDSDPEGQQRSIVAFDSVSAQGGSVMCDATCVYTPPGAFTGTDTFSYTVADPQGLTSTATVTVVVN